MKSISKDAHKNPTIALLDGVRVFACLNIIAYQVNYLTQHDHVWTMQGVGPVLSALALAGSNGITLFFMLSGFLLFMPYAKSLLFDTPWPSIRRYYLRRIFRIWPGYYISLILLIVIFHQEYLSLNHWHQLLLFITFFMDAGRNTYQAIDGLFWAIAIDWQFCILLPVLALGLHWIVQHGSLQRRLALLSLSLLGLIAWGVMTRYWGRSWQMNPSQPGLLPAPLHHLALFFLYGQNGKYLEDFAMGMLVCVMYLLAQQEPYHLLSQLCEKYCRWIWASGILWLFFAIIWPHTALAGPLTPYIGAHNWLAEMTFAIGFGLCGLALLSGPSDLRAPFEWRPVRWISQLSYGMYIWHLPFIIFFSSYIVPLLYPCNLYLLYGAFWLWIICIMLPFCYNIYNLIEQPAIKFGNNIIGYKG